MTLISTPTRPTNPAKQTVIDTVTGLLKQSIGSYEYIVVSDGSGHPSKKCGGCCALIIDQSFKIHPVMVAHSHTTVTRMEFTGLLEALAIIKTLPDYYVGARVLWLCDHKSMVESVNDKMVAKTNEDLWVLYDYHSMSFTIEAKHIPRDNHNLIHNLADLHASTMRETLLDYVEGHTNFPKEYDPEDE